MWRRWPAIFALALLPVGVAAQGPERINVYRYILDIDVPEPSA